MPNASPPNLRDAHLHLDEHGIELSCVNLASCISKSDSLAQIAIAAESKAHDDWVRAVCGRVEAWNGDPWPTADELHAAAGGRPCVICSFDHHCVVASTRALEQADISRDTPDPEGGIIGRTENGDPTGLLLEAACKPVYAAIPQPDDAQYLAAVRTAVNDLASRGFVEVHDMLGPQRLPGALLELEKMGELPLRVVMFVVRDRFDEMVRQSQSWRSDRISVGGLKIFTDGTLNSTTAHMLTEYTHPMPDHPRGTPLMTRQQIDESIRHADSLGYPIAAHAIGDAAVRAVLDAIEAVAPRTTGQRIEHAQFVDTLDIPRFAQLGVIASLQPCHLLTDIEAINRLMPHRAARAFPLRNLVDAARKAGCDPAELIYLGSDTPVVEPSPQDNLQAAVHRTRAGGKSPVVAPEQAISEEEAWGLMGIRQ